MILQNVDIFQLNVGIFQLNVDIFQLNVDKFQLKYYRPLGSWSALSHHILHCQLQEKFMDLGAILTILHVYNNDNW